MLIGEPFFRGSDVDQPGLFMLVVVGIYNFFLDGFYWARFRRGGEFGGRS